MRFQTWFSQKEGSENPIVSVLAEWVRDSEPETARDAALILETCSCADGAAPSGLIYNSDIRAKIDPWWDAIEQSLREYRDATGEGALSNMEDITAGSLVWFAVEWFAHELASEFQSAMDAGEFPEPTANDMNGYHNFRGDEQHQFYGSFRVFWHTEGALFLFPGTEDVMPEGWYWQAEFPGCLPDGEPIGPFETSREAYEDALGE